MTISSDSSIAGSASVSLSQSTSLLNSINVVPTASRINVSENAAAEESISTFQNGLKQMSTSVVSAGDNIHSVAKEFECIDQKIAQLPKFNFPGGFS
ncbi:TIGR04197 family type VII secretion effector [Enterococcus sp. 5H]|uniref:TIGR04197 family type VII secretion effector n=1 Tax=Enterococcus sp. 5H TaxID=1229490 RepID=UPI002302E2B3|nr:TIGR04197 family type VII secretion effector [Enterococcus sp. 5H]MDA9472181.1 hypothetical protein [Enterococcus sp. 5H]